jgi:hypothetical protein
MIAKRRLRLEQSIAGVGLELERVHDEIVEAYSDIKKSEQAIENRIERKRVAAARREQANSDEMGLDQHRRSAKRDR